MGVVDHAGGGLVTTSRRIPELPQPACSENPGVTTMRIPPARVATRAVDRYVDARDLGAATGDALATDSSMLSAASGHTVAATDP
jgi:hypothetical protein